MSSKVINSNILATIVEHKVKEVAERKNQISITALKKMPLFLKPALSLKENLIKPSATGIIAEFKRKSPSKGMINEKASVQEVTAAYHAYGAAGISVLTDTHFFGGSLADLTIAIENPLPVLRKEFIIDEFQIFESKAYGASVILLIAACLKATQTQILAATAKELGMEVLLELHDESELGHICDEVDMVGINNRSLKSFEVDIQHSLTLKNQLPQGKLSIAESGIYSVETYQLLKEKGFNGFLMGEYFMKKENPALEFEQFTKAIKTT